MTAGVAIDRQGALLVTNDIGAARRLATERAGEMFGKALGQELADRLNRQQSFVVKTENGERRLDVIEFFVDARAIGLDPMKAFRAVQKSIG